MNYSVNAVLDFRKYLQWILAQGSDQNSVTFCTGKLGRGFIFIPKLLFSAKRVTVLPTLLNPSPVEGLATSDKLAIGLFSQEFRRDECI